MVRPLILTGGPAVGKTTCARALAEEQPRAAYIDADDIRQLVVAGAVAPWSGPEGEAQLALGARNVAALARNFLRDGFVVAIADFTTPATVAVYRAELPTCLVVHLRISLPGAKERAATRRVYLTDDEFELLHRLDATQPPPADAVVEVDRMRPEEQIAVLRDLWRTADEPGTRRSRRA